jgi:sRNA-binding regulator protein Hfq
MTETIQYLDTKNDQDDLINKNMEIYEMVSNYVNQSEQLRLLGIDDQISLFFRNISKSNNIVEFLNNFHSHYSDITEYLVNKEQLNIELFFEQYIIENLKSQKHLIKKIYKHKIQSLKYDILIENYSFEIFLEITEPFSKFTTTYLGSKFNLNINIFDADKFSDDDYNDYYEEIHLW